MEPVTLLFWRPHTLYGHIVELFTGKRWAHCAIQHQVAGRTMITQAVGSKGVVSMDPHHCTVQPNAVLAVPWLDNDKVTSWLMDRWGLNYGWRDVIEFPTHNDHRHHGYFCSELIAELLIHEAGDVTVPPGWLDAIQHLRSLTPVRTGPGDLYDVLPKTSGPLVKAA